MSLQTVRAFRLKELSAVVGKLKNGASASETQVQLPNPFLPHKNPLTGRWAPPKYSLRQQADLVKSAKASNLTHLLPFGPKSAIIPLSADAPPAIPPKPVSTEWWQTDVIWKDSKPPTEKKEKEGPCLDEDELPKKVTPRIEVKQMEGLAALKMYAGRKRMFKGHKWERVQAQRKKRTEILMRDMTKRVTRYKEVRTALVGLLRDSIGVPPVVPPSQAQSTQATKGCQSPQVTILELIHRTLSPSNTTVHPQALAFAMFVRDIFHRQRRYKHGGTRQESCRIVRDVRHRRITAHRSRTL